MVLFFGGSEVQKVRGSEVQRFGSGGGAGGGGGGGRGGGGGSWCTRSLSFRQCARERDRDSLLVGL